MRNPDRAGRRREDKKNRIWRFYIMLLARRNNSVSNWLDSWFNDNFFNTSLMPHMNATAPAVNVKDGGCSSWFEERYGQDEHRQGWLSECIHREQG